MIIGDELLIPEILRLSRIATDQNCSLCSKRLPNVVALENATVFATPNPTDVSLRLCRGHEGLLRSYLSFEEIIGQEGKEEVLAGALTLPRHVVKWLLPARLYFRVESIRTAASGVTS